MQEPAKNSNYIAFTGDVIHSRNFSETVMVGLRRTLDRFNQRYNPLVPFGIQAGDEIQGLVATDKQPLKSVTWLMSELFPLTVRWGIGYGPVTSPLRDSTRDMRGKVFEFSRAALKSSIRRKRLFSISSDRNDTDYLNTILGLISGTLERWNALAFHRYQLFCHHKTAYAVSLVEGVSVEAVNKNLNLRNIRLVLESIEFIDKKIMG